MNSNDWRRAADELAADLVAVAKRAERISFELPGLCRALDVLKVDVLKYKLETERRHIARTQGFTTLRKDKKKLVISLGAAVAGLILGGALSKDKYFALNTGIETFDASLQGFGNSRCAVSLDKQMLVFPRDQTYPGRLWVTWESLDEALEELKKKPLAGEQLGDIEAIISNLKQERGKLEYLRLE